MPLSNYTTLGYDFSNSNWTDNQYYSINHPYMFPQRIQDNFNITWLGTYSLKVETDLPFCSGRGSSGGPLVPRRTALSSSGAVRGVITGGVHVYPDSVYDRFAREYLPYIYKNYATKIGTIEREIKRHCWKNRDSSDIIRNGLQSRSVLVNNSAALAAYFKELTITDVPGIEAAAYSGNKSRCTFSYVPGDQCNISAFTLPAVYPGSTDFWQVTVAVKEITVGADFSYTPAGQSELNLSTVIIDGGIAASLFRKADSTPSVADKMLQEAAGEFKVYPNPSPDGTFHIALPDTGPYSIAVFTIDGKKIYGNNCTENPFQLQLPKLARGNYVLHVYRAGLTVPAFKTLIAY